MPARKIDQAPEVPVNGPLLRRARKALGLTQVQLAEKARVSPTTISKMENGSAVRPTIVKAVAGHVGESYANLVLLEAPISKLPPAQEDGAIKIEPTKDGRVTVFVRFDVDPDGPDVTPQARRLLLVLATALGMDSSVLPKDFLAESGSINVYIRVASSVASKIFQAFIKGELRSINVEFVGLSTSWPPISRVTFKSGESEISHLLAAEYHAHAARQYYMSIDAIKKAAYDDTHSNSRKRGK